MIVRRNIVDRDEVDRLQKRFMKLDKVCIWVLGYTQMEGIVDWVKLGIQVLSDLWAEKRVWPGENLRS